MPLLVDTGILYAVADRSDAWHEKTIHYLRSAREPLLTPVTTIPEVAYLLRERLGADAEARFVRSIVAKELAVEELGSNDWARTEVLMTKYRALGLVDASVIAIAERLKLSTVATTDRRHFRLVRPAHVERFTLVP